jgi:hypothetical protein
MLRCGGSGVDCVIVVAGFTPSLDLGIASTPISFAPPTPTTRADCKRGGWRNFASDRGEPFRNQGSCERVVAGRQP